MSQTHTTELSLASRALPALIIMIPFVLAGAAGVVLVSWHLSPAAVSIEERGPRPGEPVWEASLAAHSSSMVEESDVLPPGPKGKLEKGEGQPSALDGSWPGFRGPNRDGISPETIPLASSWPTEGPPKLWEIEVAEGYAGAAIHKGRVYLMDYDTEAREDVIRCLSLDDGRSIWRYSYPVLIKRNHGYTRTTPALTDRFLVAMGPKCQVTCLNAQTGEWIWSTDLEKHFGTEAPDWYTGQCPLIVNDQAIIAVAGKKVFMMAVDCATGKVKWRSPNTHGLSMTHLSIGRMNYNGHPTYIYGGMKGVAGISAEDGVPLWFYEGWKPRVAWCATPLPIGDNKILLTSGYNMGSQIIALTEEGGKTVANAWVSLKARVFGSEQHTPILYKNHLFGVRPNGELVCLDAQGNLKWESGPAHRWYKGYGSWLIADDKLFVMNGALNPKEESGTLSLLRADPEAFQILAKARALDGYDASGPMAIAGGRLVIRSVDKLACLDVRAK